MESTKHLLTEKEYFSLIQISEHERICRKDESDIRAIESSIATIKTKLKLEKELTNALLSYKDIGEFIGYISNRASELIQCLVENHKENFPLKKGLPINFELMYHGVWHPLFITKWAYINKKGLIIDGRNKEEIEIESIKLDSLIKLVICIEKFCNKEKRLSTSTI